MEHQQQSPEASDSTPEAVRAARELPEALGFIETDQLRQLRAELIAAMQAGTSTVDLATQYRLLAEELVSKQEDDDDFERAKLGLGISIGFMRRDGGREDAYRADMEDAILHAHNMGLDDVVILLEESLDEAA